MMYMPALKIKLGVVKHILPMSVSDCRTDLTKTLKKTDIVTHHAVLTNPRGLQIIKPSTFNETDQRLEYSTVEGDIDIIGGWHYTFYVETIGGYKSEITPAVLFWVV